MNSYRISELSLAIALAGFVESAQWAKGQNFDSAFGPYRAYATASWPETVAIGDVNNDGRNDVVLGFRSSGDSTNNRSILVYQQTSAGTLAAPLQYAAGDEVDSLVLADFTGDGRIDAAVGRMATGIRIFIQGELGTFERFEDYATSNSLWICTGDFNNDGRSDLAGIGSNSEAVDLFFQSTTGTMIPSGSKSAPYAGDNDIEAGDVNNDGLTDIVVMSGQGTLNLSVLLQTAEGFANAENYPGGGQGLGVGDLNSDGRKDVAVSGFLAAHVRLWMQQNDGTLALTTTNSTYAVPETLAVTDVDLNGKDDIVVLHGGGQQVGVYFQTNTAAFTVENLFEIPYVSDYSTHGLAIGDITGDGMPDLAIADHNNGLVILTNRLTRPIRHLTDMENAAGTARFRLNGQAGKRYVIETSPDLSTWTPLVTNTVPPGGFVSVEDPDLNQRSRRFYRAILETNEVVVTSNDLFDNRISIAGTGGTVQGSNVGATKEPGEFDHGGSPGGKSVWWSWTPSFSGIVTITTEGSLFDTTLAVYRGSTLAGLQFVAEDDDSGEARQSRVLIDAAAGTTYQIAVDGFEGASGNITLSVISGASNDAFANAWPMAGALDDVLGSNFGATRQEGEPFHWGVTGGASVWWAWQAPATGWVTVTTAASTFDTILAVYVGSQVDDLTLIANNDDDDFGNLTSLVDFFATAGTVYRIAVDGSGGQTGVVWLSLGQP
ncbi:MAG TPA: VCBS repeat-containing protein [Verrucomicrobiae bacterium]|nr:VCBS repeat-containing protein [Verrucomicrobiae bacterium]